MTKILSLQEYCGDILNFKTYSKSYKNKKRLENDRENWVIFKDVHEPIIERSVFEQVQQKRGKIRKRRTNEGEHNMFSGLLVCADCGSNLHFHFNQGNPEIKYFNCSNYKGNRGSCTSTHYVRVDFLEQVVLGVAYSRIHTIITAGIPASCPLQDVGESLLTVSWLFQCPVNGVGQANGLRRGRVCYPVVQGDVDLGA